MRTPLVTLLATLIAAAPAVAQQQALRALTAADYAHAERFLRPHTAPLVFGGTVRPTWLPDGRFWYRNAIPEGFEFVLADPGHKRRARVFDHTRLAAALSAVTDTTYDPYHLPFTRFERAPDGHSIAFDMRRRHVTCDIRAYRCTAAENAAGSENAAGRGTDRNAVISPDGRRAAFVRDYNLWSRDLGSGQETQLTTDGIEDFAYATNNAGWTKSDRPVLLWSPDSRKIATFQHDQRGVGEMYLVSTTVGHPKLEAWKYPLPGDSLIFRIERVVIDLDGPRVVRLKMPPDPHRSSICDHVACRGSGWADVEWSPDGSRLAFVSTSRDHKREQLRIADPETGDVRDVMEERVETFFESGFNSVNWHLLSDSNEVLWYSQRDDWGHLYLYDLTTGELEHRVTSGKWKVLEVLRVDEDDRTVYFTAAGREPGDPYFQYLYRVGLDGTGLALLTPDSANHTVTFSPSGRTFLDSYSTPVAPPVTVVRDTHGKRVLELEKADISRLLADGWHPPVPIQVKARDGVTDLYGLMYRPANFDPSHSYPILNYVYPGPQTGSVGSRSFLPSRSDKQALAELGFIVVEVDAMGTPMRSRSFQAAYYGDMGDNGIPDQIAALKELAGRYSWMDLSRVGVWGHSGGGFASTAAILTYPDFYKVAVSEAGNHDNREYEDDWGEKWQGLLETYPDGTTNYDNQANQLRAENLKGKILLAHGTMDDNVPPYNTLLVVDALIAANKDFDLLLLPNRHHGFGSEPYMIRRRWDYFVRNLLGAEPPRGYRIGENGDAARGGRRTTGSPGS